MSKNSAGWQPAGRKFHFQLSPSISGKKRKNKFRVASRPRRWSDEAIFGCCPSVRTGKTINKPDIGRKARRTEGNRLGWTRTVSWHEATATPFGGTAGAWAEENLTSVEHPAASQPRLRRQTIAVAHVPWILIAWLLHLIRNIARPVTRARRAYLIIDEAVLAPPPRFRRSIIDRAPNDRASRSRPQTAPVRLHTRDFVIDAFREPPHLYVTRFTRFIIVDRLLRF